VLLAVQLQALLWVPAFLPLVTLVPLLFPDGALPSPRWRVAVVAAVAGMTLLAVGAALYDEAFVGRVTLEKPLVSPLAGPLFLAGAALVVPQALAAFVALLSRWRRAEGLARRQLSVLVLAVGALVVDVVVTAFLPWPLSVVAQAVAVALLPAALTVAVTRHRLYELDTALCRMVAALVLAACLAGIYLTLFALLGAVLPSGGAAASVVAAGLTGLALVPLAAPVGRAVDRLYYGDRAQPGVVLTVLAERLRVGLTPDEVTSAVADTVTDHLRLVGCRVDLALEGAPPDPAPGEESVPLLHRGTTVGRLVVRPRPGEQTLDPQDREVLEVVAAQAAPALAAVRLSARLQRSREHLVAAREEERRRLRRDLHDGVGAALAGARLQLESAYDRVTDPETRRMLDAASGAVGEAVDGVRHATDDLRPPALDELGLAACLRLLAERMTGPATEVRAAVGELPPVGAAAEVAGYRIASEALNNARRHAGARVVELVAGVDAGRLQIRVCDDGRGLPERTRAGAVGLESMRQRAEELGGRLRVESSEAGTVVEAVLPVEER
jgi:signal transduction histidine kinase